MTKKALNAALAKAKRGELSLGAKKIELQTPPTQEGIEALKVPQLQKLVNRTGLPYSEIRTMVKEELVYWLVINRKRKEEEPQESVDEYLSNGGTVTEVRPQLIPRLKPETPASSYPKHQRDRVGGSPTKKKRQKKLKGANKPSNPDGVSLQSILEEYGVKGTAARKALRLSDIEKPGKQWVWDVSDKKTITKVKKFIKGIA